MFLVKLLDQNSNDPIMVLVDAYEVNVTPFGVLELIKKGRCVAVFNAGKWDYVMPEPNTPICNCPAKDAVHYKTCPAATNE
jgi:hypothetical protein